MILLLVVTVVIKKYMFIANQFHQFSKKKKNMQCWGSQINIIYLLHCKGQCYSNGETLSVPLVSVQSHVDIPLHTL